MIEATTVTMNLTADERRVYYDRLRDVGPFQVEEDRISGDMVHIRLPAVDTQGERDTHLARIGDIQADRDKVEKARQQREKQQFDREVRANLKKFGEDIVI